MPNTFWSRLDELIEASEIIIDRPKDKAHPRYPDLIFPLDYGYLKGTTAMDGGGIDVWVGSARHRRLTAIACTVDMVKKDAEIKLIIGCTEAEIESIRVFYDGKYMAAIIIRRDD
jgi:inorganic pyrophosphatase